MKQIEKKKIKEAAVLLAKKYGYQGKEADIYKKGFCDGIEGIPEEIKLSNFLDKILSCIGENDA